MRLAFALLFSLFLGVAHAQVTPGTSPLTIAKGGTNAATAAAAFANLVQPSGATALGGVKSITCSSHTWFNTLSTAGVFGCTQPNFTDLAGSIAGSQIPSGTVTNAMLANSASGATFKGNPTASSAAQQDFTLASLAPLTSPSATLDLVPCVDHTSGTIKSCTPSVISSAVGSGVTSLNGGTGAIVGVDTSTINAQTGNYPIVNTDCGKVIYATGGQNTITLPSTSGFSTSCTITVKNGEVYTGIGTAHAKILAGFPSDLQTRLWPLQATTVKIQGSSWVTTHNPGRWILPTSAEICVAQNGNDANDGLAAGTGCMQTPQAAVVVIGNQWDGGGYNSCSLGFYTGGTNTLSGANQTGQSVGCFITINIRGAITWASTISCWTGGDGSITIVNANLGFTLTVACNTAGSASEAQFKCHQYCVFDINGTFIWLPPGSNVDKFYYADLQGSATLNVTVNIGDGINTFAPLTFAQCVSHCSKLTLSGSVAFSAHVAMGVALALSGGSVISTGLSWPGATVISPTTPTGNSVLIINGTTIPGGTSPASGFPAQNGNFGLICNTAC